ncbi:MAG TPA: TOBE domain-containing protein, partial [Terriglobia bacterium]|nr:TOBE domain-containing protein [Terriglobia bacterium]
RLLHQSSRVTTVYVTHDQDEAMAMSDRIAVLHRGKIHQVGIPEDIYERPATRFVADFIGRNNVLDATISNTSEHAVVVRFVDGAELAIDPRQRAAGVTLIPGERVGVCLRAESLQLASGNGIFSGVVEDVEYTGPVRSCVVRTDVGNLQVEIPSSAARPSSGDRVRLAISPATVHLVGSP